MRDRRAAGDVGQDPPAEAAVDGQAAQLDLGFAIDGPVGVVPAPGATPVNGDRPDTQVGDTSTAPSPPVSHLRRWRSMVPRPVPPLIKLGIVALVVEYLVVPQIAGTRKALSLLGGVDVTWLIFGLLFEMGAWVAYAQLTRAVLPRDSDPGLLTVLRIQMTTLSVSHCVPGGTAAGSPLGYRLLTQAGVDRASVGFALATQGLGSAVVLNVIFWLAVVISIPVWGFSAVYGIAGLVGLVLISLLAVLVTLLTRGEQRMGTLIGRVAQRIPFLEALPIQELFHRLADRVEELRSEPRVLVRATLWAAGNWLLDAASLYVFVGAFGHFPNPDGLLVAFGLANVLAALPITPGGLGVVETVLSSTLVGYGTPRGVAILGVIAYRLVNFWLPIPTGGLTYLSLQVHPGAAGLDARRQVREQRRQAWRRFFDVLSGRNRSEL